MKQVAPGQDLASRYPELAEQWHSEKNEPLLPSQITPGSSRKVWWQCHKGHEWEATPNNRSKGKGCPYCTGNHLLPGYNDLATINPQLAAQWHLTKNNNAPSRVMPHSNKKVWWQCDHGHEWEATPNNRSKGKGCPYCTGRKASTLNNVATMRPDLAAEWDHEQNALTPSEVSIGAGQSIIWKCFEGHIWSATVYSRAQGNGCPYCSGRYPLAGINDLVTSAPHIAKLWDEMRNGTDALSSTLGSAKKRWWKCEQGHSWEATVKDLTRQDGKHTGCPECSLKLISRGEQELADWLVGLGVVVRQNERGLITPQELDLFLPEYKFAIEFNGLYWHSEAVRKDKNYHLKKVQACDAAGVILFQVWEDDWRDRKEIIKRMISHRLRLSDSPVLYARKAEVVHLSSSQAQSFLEENHIQGHATGRLYLGLNDKQSQELVAVMVLKVMPHGIYLERYATACRVPGGFTKLLKRAIAELNPQQIITFADRSVSQGDLYDSNGFVVDSLLEPDYSYLVQGSRVHKFNYRLKRFREDPNLKYEEGLSETQLAQLNRLHRIWDSGKTRYVLKP